MADCSKTLEYVREKERMCNFYLDKTSVKCVKCPLSLYDKGCDIVTQKRIDDVQKWSDSHPIKTRQSEFLKIFPNARINENGICSISPCSIDSRFLDGNCRNDCYTCIRNIGWRKFSE